MPIDPMTMMLITTALNTGLTALTGNKGETKSTYNKGQKGGINDIFDIIQGIKGGSADITQNPQFQQGNEWLMGLFNDPEFFKSFEAPLQRQFQEETVPGLANRFASMGSGGSLGSTGFRNQLAREGSNLSTNIAAMRGGMQQNAIPQLLGYAQQPFQNLMNLYNTGLGHPTENVYQPPSAGPFSGPLNALTSGFSQGYGQQQGAAAANQQKVPGQSPLTY